MTSGVGPMKTSPAASTARANAGFSARISMLYQDNIFKQPDFWMQNRVNSELAIYIVY